ncbi:MAG: glycosyl hydrolase family 25 [Candidatus Paraimprobicoccus trichonymphae]|uniref:Glycosyl hydrolase family 25 n=1 Tax=Candidatus Paraimprobicoccus trichonymphae TaxID=3033793 RepID=A0AA48HX34_9FIRM|nr:MAG: glycosyl hydrolase family 25 [Candidatus Paraimprobicoccus trichonymphae]
MTKKYLELVGISKGIDVSKWQGDINWEKVKKDGIEFAMIKESHGKKSTANIDAKFKENVAGAKNNGIYVGTYHYSYADNENDAVLEAQFCLENIAGLQLEYPVVFDIEDKEQHKLSTDQRTDICFAFCKEIEKAGYYAMVYSNVDWFTNYLNKDYISKNFDIWLAQWNVSKPAFDCGIWQNSDIGVVSGISTNVDLDVSYKDYPQIIKNKGLNGFSKSISNLKIGDKVKVKNAIQYDGKPFTVYFPDYEIIEIKNDRVVIGKDGVVTSAVDINNLTKS